MNLADILDGLIGKVITRHVKAFWEDGTELFDVYVIKSLGCSYKDFCEMYVNASEDEIQEAKDLLKPKKEDCGDCSNSGGCDCDGDMLKQHKPKLQWYLGILDEDKLIFYNTLFVDIWQDERTSAILMQKKDITDALGAAMALNNTPTCSGCSKTK